MSLFGINIEEIITQAFRGNLYPVTLTREVPGTYTPGTDTVTGSSEQTYTTEGILESYSEELVAQGLVSESDRKALVLASPLGTVPQPGDKLTIHGETFTVVAVPQRDPVGATYSVRVKL